MNTTFCNRLRSARRAAGYSQIRLGEICGLKDTLAIWKYENGKYYPQVEHLIADTLNVSIDYLLGRTK